MSPRTTTELENMRDGGVASAVVADISNADLLITDEWADAPALANLRSEGLEVVTAEPGAG